MMKFAARLVVVMAIGAGCNVVGGAQVKPGKADQLRVVHMNSVSLPGLLAQLAADYEITFSLEVDPEHPPTLVTLDLREVNFSQLMDGLIATQPGYQWRVRDDAIEVYPSKAASGFLDTSIQTFEARGVDRDMAIWNLLALPQVQAQWRSLGLKPRGPYSPSEQTKKEKLTFVLNGVTLRRALNQIADQSGARFWIFRRFPDGTFEITTSARPLS